MKKFAALLLTLAFDACTKNPSSGTQSAARPPEEVVKEFVTVSAHAQSGADKRKLEELTAGELRRAFSSMTDESFKMAYINSGVKINEMKVLEAKTETDSATVLYQLAVENKQGTDPTNEVNEREVLLTLSQGAWYIESIRLRGTDKVAFTRGMIF